MTQRQWIPILGKTGIDRASEKTESLRDFGQGSLSSCTGVGR